eukprot:CAMPEP_0174297746 /NCGR_PEP_ID=MMETSP0809-20121228/51845_1 /TAXON_ID=73025 ORGANISM="Eutreptiella gymnastica-like, Strain CCMP1594" /NCGR_SAMPLE_ID=MMETSP0809 /ASSEMBLY_ACC=CAM_ASM_000658 /LENGTH=86 /DNA_ID=CAMNT_0015401731 /DNA_START=10 /DNA_END=270 /DNA_ORIENTATION=+
MALGFGVEGEPRTGGQPEQHQRMQARFSTLLPSSVRRSRFKRASTGFRMVGSHSNMNRWGQGWHDVNLGLDLDGCGFQVAVGLTWI